MRSLRRAYLLAALALGCVNVTSPEATAVGGLYILTQFDGASLPAPPATPGSAIPCPPAVTDGELVLDPAGSRNPQTYGINVYVTRACDPDGIPIDGTPIALDAGAWSISGAQINFVSSPYNAKGGYNGTAHTGTAFPTVDVMFAGHTYTFRRLTPPTVANHDSGITVLVVDQQGARVGAALVVLHAANGQVLRMYSGITDPQVVAPASPGTEMIAVAPPGGYTFAPSQPNPFSATIVSGQMTTVTVVLTKIAP